MSKKNLYALNEQPQPRAGRKRGAILALILASLLTFTGWLVVTNLPSLMEAVEGQTQPTPAPQPAKTHLLAYPGTNGTITLTMVITDPQAVATGLGTSRHFTVSANAMYIRTGPGVVNPSLGTVSKGQTFLCLGRNADGTWCLAYWQLGKVYAGPAWISLNRKYVTTTASNSLADTPIFQVVGDFAVQQ